MFQNVRVGGQLFVLHKGATPRIEMAQVTDITRPNPYAMPMMQNLGTKPEETLTLTIKVGGQDVVLPGIPYTSDVMDYPSKGMLITTTRESMNLELGNLRSKSVEALNSVDYHKGIIVACDKLLQEINPEYAERQSQREDINDLKSQMATLMEMVSRLSTGTATAVKAK